MSELWADRRAKADRVLAQVRGRLLHPCVRPEVALIAARRLRGELAAVQHQLVSCLRAEGWTWQEIGALVGPVAVTGSPNAESGAVPRSEVSPPAPAGDRLRGSCPDDADRPTGDGEHAAHPGQQVGENGAAGSGRQTGGH